ncbi:binding-protein-dependent transport systems inner membrane component [Xylanimonas cellulosilytica DSM 15894]|uniref:Binding-protein-dependent transport systems inner membrane component n=1 Tax=Xylanimonas cellulosilytica (strain DSM 15894 / JCM 12276 / CECT 5975 / KCTC 9989 / LMG 20990 / NBRC 107835 / XIL07) TaxID=446471 RepID=D1BX94_XYLCX|nr:sugar ABC transporter permease [Xylanimonas cellulosilytica]ACZ31662.1 binding-protein-dependent transport systems inner membrane component [Xylanimonas cellulosilytica DSM 15894]
MSSLGELRTLAQERRSGKAGKPAVSRRENLAGYLFLSPWIVGMLVFTIGPMLASLYLAFTRYRLLKPPEWIGGQNFADMLNDPVLAHSLRVTFTYVFVGVPLQLAVALGLALLLDRGLRGMGFYRSVFYLPSLLGGSVAIAILWRQVFGKNGIVNAALGLIGIHDAPGWIGHPDYALGTLIILHVWTFGSPLIIFLAGLRQIPEMYYEAAEMDGAGKIRRFVSITVPLLTPIIFFNLVLQVIFAFQSFTQAYIVSGGTGGPSDSTMFYTLYLYRKAFVDLQMGYASAMAWLLLVIIGALTALMFWLSKFWVFYDD